MIHFSREHLRAVRTRPGKRGKELSMPYVTPAGLKDSEEIEFRFMDGVRWKAGITLGDFKKMQMPREGHGSEKNIFS